MGTLDGLLTKSQNDAEPGVELYAPERVKWVQPVTGAAQKKAMPDSAAA